MQAVWIDAGQNIDAAKLRRHKITAPYFPAHDARITPAYLDGVAAQGFSPGIYFAWNWYPELNGSQFAERVHSELLRIGWLGNPPVCADIETHDVSYIRAFFRRWRQLRPTRRTDWTLEGFQGGLFDSAAVAEIVRANVGIAPQFYAGDMTPLPHGVTLDLLVQGFPASLMLGVWDAARLPYRWHGYAFTQGRLP